MVPTLSVVYFSRFEPSPKTETVKVGTQLGDLVSIQSLWLSNFSFAGKMFVQLPEPHSKGAPSSPFCIEGVERKARNGRSQKKTTLPPKKNKKVFSQRKDSPPGKLHSGVTV